jgi:hypothetical protein
VPAQGQKPKKRRACHIERSMWIESSAHQATLDKPNIVISKARKGIGARRGSRAGLAAESVARIDANTLGRQRLSGRSKPGPESVTTALDGLRDRITRPSERQLHRIQVVLKSAIRVQSCALIVIQNDCIARGCQVGLTETPKRSTFVLMEVETLGIARSLGWKVHMRCAHGYWGAQGPCARRQALAVSKQPDTLRSHICSATWSRSRCDCPPSQTLCRGLPTCRGHSKVSG